MIWLRLISPRMWLNFAILLVIAGAAYYVYDWAYDRGADAVQVKWDAVEKERADQLAIVNQKAADDTQNLQNKVDAQRKVSNDKINILNGDLRNALERLRDRPERPDSGGVSAPAATGSSCTGASLFRPDSEFLTRLAGDADKLRIALETCQSQYNAAREALTP